MVALAVILFISHYLSAIIYQPSISLLPGTSEHEQGADHQARL